MQLSKLTRLLLLLILGSLCFVQAFGENKPGSRSPSQDYTGDKENGQNQEDGRSSPTKSDEQLARNLFKDADYEHFMEAAKSEILGEDYLESQR